MTELELMIEFHLNSNRQGPGSTEITKAALEIIGCGKNPGLRIADIGSGTGRQTLDIAKATCGHVKAVDLFPRFLEKLKRRSRKAGMDDQIKIIKASMDDLPLREESLDILWSEGAIYIMGFKKGLEYWRQFIKPEGFIAVTDVVWLTDERPKEIEEFWTNEYPEIDSIENKKKIFENAGYELIGYITLPENCWTDEYYAPMQKRYDSFAKKHGETEEVKALMDAHRHEAEMYDKYGEHYSYGCFIGKKTA